MFIRKSAVLSRFPVSNSSFYERIRKGIFPSPVGLGGRASAWIESEVDAVCAYYAQGKEEHELKALVRDLHEQRQHLPNVSQTSGLNEEVA